MPICSSNSAKAAFASLATLALCAAAHAAPDINAPRSAADELASAQQHARALADRSRTLALDTTPPVLRRFNLSGSVNAQLPAQAIDADIRITDNLSGVVYYYLELRSPSGTAVYRSKTVPAPETNVSSTLSVGSPYSSPGFTVFSQPGRWVATFLYAYDANGNVASYSQTDLAGFGNTTFTVSNSGGYDIVPPSLLSGSILTTTLRRSRAPVGTGAGTPPYASADMRLQDAGNGAISGTYYGYLSFCLPDSGTGCQDTLFLIGYTNRKGLVGNTLRVGGQISSTQTPGVYKLRSAYLYDIAGNSLNLVSTEFGGSTDFSTLFPETSIVINP
jgi:hypothetical protein